MRKFTYTQYTGDDDDDLSVSAEQILDLIKDFLFLADGDLEQALDMLRETGALGEGEQADRAVERIRQVLEKAGYVDSDGKFTQLSDKGLRMLSEHTLDELLSSIQKGHAGQHETPFRGSGDLFGSDDKPYEFGDHLNLDIARTFHNAFIRNGVDLPIAFEEEDLQIIQTEHQSQCATVLMLDISHSMILYGEDRFTPAKKVALALAHLIETKYTQDSLDVLLFFDDAQQISVREILTSQVGPYYTNTKAGLALAQRLLARRNSENKQIIMVTDGKPSAIWHKGEIVRHSWIDPWIIHETLLEAEKCRSKGITINTFMLARDLPLVEYVQQQTQITKGKAYFTSPHTLGQYLLIDYMNQRRKKIV